MDETTPNLPSSLVAPIFNLTSREVEVMQCAADGMSLAKTGEHLFISPDTVESHRTKVIQKMRAANITEAVTIGLRNKIIK